MKEKRSITYVCVRKGGAPGAFDGFEQETACYCVPEGGIGGQFCAGRILIEEIRFKVGNRDVKRPPDPRVEEKAHVVIVYCKFQGSIQTYSVDGTRYFYVLGANHDGTMEVLEQMGFELCYGGPEGNHVT